MGEMGIMLASRVPVVWISGESGNGEFLTSLYVSGT